MEDKFIAGYDNKYTIDRNGVITSYHKKNPIVRKPHLNTSGYLHIRLLNKGKDESISLHVLIAKHFIPNPENLASVNHKDGNKLNNSIDNLEWCSHSDNQKHAYENNLREALKGIKNPKAKLSENQVKDIFASHLSRKELAGLYGVSLSTIDTIKSKRQWKSVLQ